jgi:glutaredoxin-like protein NrdH
MTTVTVYGKPACVQCNATYRALEKKGIDYQAVDLSRDAAALARVRSLGHMQAPVVVAGAEHWSGFRPDKIDELAGHAAADPEAGPVPEVPGQLDALDLPAPRPSGVRAAP